MKGCRPLTRQEVKHVLSKAQDGRDQALLTLGFCTGYRISELLSIKLKDLATSEGQILKYVSVKASNTKTKEGRSVLLNSDAKKVLTRWVNSLLEKGYDLNTPLFISRKHAQDGQLKSIGRQQAWRILTTLFKQAQIFSCVATHTLRKTYADMMLKALKGNLAKLQIALGHKSINSTVSYISFSHSDIESAIKQIRLF